MLDVFNLMDENADVTRYFGANDQTNNKDLRTWMKPPGCKFVYIFVVGAGGGGGGGASGGAGGAAGAAGGGSFGAKVSFQPTTNGTTSLFGITAAGGGAAGTASSTGGLGGGPTRNFSQNNSFQSLGVETMMSGRYGSNGGGAT